MNKDSLLHIESLSNVQLEESNVKFGLLTCTGLTFVFLLCS